MTSEISSLGQAALTPVSGGGAITGVNPTAEKLAGKLNDDARKIIDRLGFEPASAEIAALADDLAAVGLLPLERAEAARAFLAKHPHAEGAAVAYGRLIDEARPELAKRAIERLGTVFQPDDKIELVAISLTDSVEQVAGRLSNTAERAAMVGFVERRAGRMNLYFGVQPRARAFGGTRRGREGDIAEHRRVLIDVDRGEGEDDAAWAARTSAVIDRLRGLGAVAIWRTGSGGVQAMLGVEATADQTAMRRRVQVLNGTLEAFGSDPVGDLVRIARLPFTINVPNPRKRARGRVLSLAQPVEGTGNARVWPVDDLCAALRGTATPGAICGSNASSGGIDASMPATGAADARDRRPASTDRAPDLATLRARVNAIPNGAAGEPDPFPTRADQVAFVHAMAGAAGEDSEEFREIARSWCRKHPSYDPAHDEKLFDSLPWSGKFASGWRHVLATFEKHNPEAYKRLIAAEMAGAFGAAIDQPALDSAADPVMSGINQRFGVVTDGEPLGAIVDTKPGGDRVVAYIREAAFKLAFRHKRVPVGSNGKTMDAGSYWLGQPGRRNISQVGMFEPGSAPPDAVNLWTGFAIQPVAGQWPLWFEFLKTVIANGDAKTFEWLLNFLAAKLQNPLARAEHALALTGDQGCGKSFFAETLASLFPSSVVAHATDADAVFGQFNAIIEHKVLVILDEAIFGRDPRTKAKFKALITNENLLINAKNEPHRSTTNRLLGLVLSNDPTALPVEPGDRRSTVLMVGNARKRDHKFFAALAAAWHAGEAASFLHDMLARDLKGFNRREPLPTAARADVARATADAPTSWWMDTLDAGVLPGTEFAVPPSDWASGPVMTTRSALQTSAREHARRSGARHLPSPPEVATTIRRLLGDEPRRVQPRINGKKVDMLEFPSLEACREAARRALGGA